MHYEVKIQNRSYLKKIYFAEHGAYLFLADLIFFLPIFERLYLNKYESHKSENDFSYVLEYCTSFLTEK